MRTDTEPEASEADARPAIAVIMPVLNGAEHIGATLDAVLAQEGVDCEVIVVDDGCVDDSIAIAESRSGVRVLRNTSRGMDSARRLGLAGTSAPLVAMLDHDDIWHPRHLETLARALRQRPDASAAVAYYRPFMDGSPLLFDAPELDIESCDPWTTFPRTITATPSTVLVRREAIDAVGGWTNGEFGAAGDVYMWFRLAEWGPFLVNRRATVGYRIRPDSASGALARTPLVYVDQIARAASRATRERAVRHPEDADWLNRRRMIALAVRHVASGALRSNARQVARGARLLEAATRGESDGPIKAAFDQVFWHIQGHGPTPRMYGPAWRAVISGWPASARRTAPYRLRHGTMRPIVRGALLRPSAWRWRWLVEAAWCRLLLEAHGVASSIGL